MVLLHLKDQLGLFVKRTEFLPGSRFLSCRNMSLAVESYVKTQSCLPDPEVWFWHRSDTTSSKFSTLCLNYCRTHI